MESRDVMNIHVVEHSILNGIEYCMYVEQWTVSPNSSLLLSYGCLPMVALCGLWLPCATYGYYQLPCATCYCILAKTTLFIYIMTLSLLPGR
jgi:hypothetical protein